MNRKKTKKKVAKKISAEEQWLNGIKKDRTIMPTGKVGYEIIARIIVPPEDMDIIVEALELLQQWGAAEVIDQKIF